MKELVSLLDKKEVLTIAKESFLDIFGNDAHKAFVLKESKRKHQIIKQSFCFILKKGYNIPIYSIANFLEIKKDTAASYIKKYPTSSKFLNDNFTDKLENFYDLFEKRVKQIIESNSAKYKTTVDKDFEKSVEYFEKSVEELDKAIKAKERAFEQLEKIKDKIERIEFRIDKAEEEIEKNQKKLNEKKCNKIKFNAL